MSTVAYVGPERRQTSRVTVETLAYINFEPNNRGIVLDVSEGGLRFQALGAVHDCEKVRFWLSAEGYRVDAEGVLAWTDETKKFGGLRFRDLSPGALEQITRWTVQSTMVLAAESELIPPPRAFSPFTVDRPVAVVALNASAPNLALAPKEMARIRLGGFSRGLLSLFLILALLAASHFFRAYGREVGESLIHFGERLTKSFRNR
jgi:PilZ domain